MSRQTKICNYEGTPDRARPRGTSWSRNSSRLRGKCSTAGFEHGRWQLVHTATGKRCVHHALPDVGFFPKTRIGENAAQAALCAPLNLYHRPSDPRGLPPLTFYSIREADYSRPKTTTSRGHSDHPKPFPHLRGDVKCDVKGYDHDLPKPAKTKVHHDHKNGSRKKVKNNINIPNARTI